MGAGIVHGWRLDSLGPARAAIAAEEHAPKATRAAHSFLEGSTALTDRCGQVARQTTPPVAQGSPFKCRTKPASG
eukprot:jgi/Tetstr1/457745/TSEL_044290.t1